MTGPAWVLWERPAGIRQAPGPLAPPPSVQNSPGCKCSVGEGGEGVSDLRRPPWTGGKSTQRPFVSPFPSFKSVHSKHTNEDGRAPAFHPIFSRFLTPFLPPPHPREQTGDEKKKPGGGLGGGERPEVTRCRTPSSFWGAVVPGRWVGCWQGSMTSSLRILNKKAAFPPPSAPLPALSLGS